MNVNGTRFGSPRQLRIRGRIEHPVIHFVNDHRRQDMPLSIEIRDIDGNRILSVPGRIVEVEASDALALEVSVVAVLDQDNKQTRQKTALLRRSLPIHERVDRQTNRAEYNYVPSRERIRRNRQIIRARKRGVSTAALMRAYGLTRGHTNKICRQGLEDTRSCADDISASTTTSSRR